MSELPFPLEVLIEGTPISLQGSASSRRRWQTKVGNAAKKRLSGAWYYLDERPLAVTIFYFCVARMQGDIDNIVKPILDGMRTIAYVNDQVIERVVAQKFEPDVPWSFEARTVQIATALGVPPPVLYVRIDDDLSWRELR